MSGEKRVFTLKDVMDDKVTLDVEVRCDGNGITIRPIGYGEFCSTMDGHGTPILIELQNGVPVIYVWADINQEDNTHEITLGNASEAKRVEE